MKKLLALLVLFAGGFFTPAKAQEWVELLNGKNLEGWRISENPASFSLEGNLLKVAGPRAHAFYEGPVGKADFKNFELLVEVKTMTKANSGIFFHTKYQETGWPDKGYEVQVNQSHSDWRKSGSLYSFQDVKEVFVQDGDWYTYLIKVQGDQAEVFINGKLVMAYDESEDKVRPTSGSEKRFDRGTIALQAHDPESIVYYRSVKIKILE